MEDINMDHFLMNFLVNILKNLIHNKAIDILSRAVKIVNYIAIISAIGFATI